MNLRKLIREVIEEIFISNETIENFFKENNIDSDDLYYLGKGDFGEAYSIGDGRVLKITSSNNEFEIAKKIQKSNSSVFSNAFAKVYKAEIVDGKKMIILEELEEDSSIEDLFYELNGYLNEQGLSVQYLDYFDTDEIELSKEMEDFMSDLDDIIRAYRTLGIEASDIRPENMGRSKEGKIKAFDIDDKNRLI